MSKIITINTLSKFFDKLKEYFVTRAEYEIDTNVPSVDPSNTKWIDIVYPVGSIYITINDTNPYLLFGIGEWEPIEDRFLLGVGIHTAGETGGEETHLLTIDELPSHSHQYKRHAFGVNDPDPSTGNNSYGVTNKSVDEKMGNTEISGGGQPHNNMPPFLAVYIWKRIS